MMIYLSNMKNWTEEEEKLAKEEYLLMIDTLRNADEFHNEWVGEWDDFSRESFGKKKRMIKGDRDKYMKYWIEDQKIINDKDWDKLKDEEEWEADY